MVDPFIYHNPTKVYFGNDALSHLHEELPRWGSRVLIVYGGGSIKKNGIYDTIISEIEKAGLSGYEISGVKPNPEIAWPTRAPGSAGKGVSTSSSQPAAAVSSIRPRSSPAAPPMRETPGTW